VIFLIDTTGLTTAIEIPESTIVYQPATTDGTSVAGGRVRVKSVCRRGVSPWLKVGDAPMKPVEGTYILVWNYL